MDATSSQTPSERPTAPGPDVGSGQGETPEQRDVRENKDVAAFGYLWVMSVIVYFLRRDSAFVRYHSKQAMILFVISIPVWFVPYVGRLLELVLFGGMVMGFIAAAQGERRDIPIVGRLSRGEITLRDAWREIVSLVAATSSAVRELVRQSGRVPKEQPSPPTPPPSVPDPPSAP